MKELVIRNRQRSHAIDTKFLEHVTIHALEKLFKLDQYSCAIHIVSPEKMAKVNWEYLQHEGSTDVITFDYKDYPEQEGAELAGEIFISYEDAIKQASEFSTRPESELVRYVVHGLLHLMNYDDLEPAKRKVMKREENKAVQQLEKRFDFSKLSETGS
ncbi:MAG: rRNA maturation RNase YbeY [Verrucomicrobiales bacterium]